MELQRVGVIRIYRKIFEGKLIYLSQISYVRTYIRNYYPSHVHCTIYVVIFEQLNLQKSKNREPFLKIKFCIMLVTTKELVFSSIFCKYYFKMLGKQLFS